MQRIRVRAGIGLALSLVLLAGPMPALAAEPRNRTAAMWLSIAHPGLGEWYLNGWGAFDRNCPQNKFWLGFIPFYGWPGYLQVKSAIDAKNGRTNDDLTFRD
jgi:hypothetical protein